MGLEARGNPIPEQGGAYAPREGKSSSANWTAAPIGRTSGCTGAPPLSRSFRQGGNFGLACVTRALLPETLRYNPTTMEIKRLVSKYVYRIEPKPDGGFIARATDPNVPPLEAPTRVELQQKVQSTVLAGLSADFPGLKLPPQSHEMKFSFHVERQPNGTFDIHSSDPNTATINAASHDQVESHFVEKLISFVGKHMLPEASQALRSQLASGNVKVFINKASGFTVSPTHETTGSQAAHLSPSSSQFPDSAIETSSSRPVISNSAPNATIGDTGNPIDSSPITPGGGSSAKTFLLLVAIFALLAFA